MEGDENHVGMIQMVISKCLEKEALCNEFYLQAIKQTTDQPGKMTVAVYAWFTSGSPYG